MVEFLLKRSCSFTAGRPAWLGLPRLVVVSILCALRGTRKCERGGVARVERALTQ